LYPNRLKPDLESAFYLLPELQVYNKEYRYTHQEYRARKGVFEEQAYLLLRKSGILRHQALPLIKKVARNHVQKRKLQAVP
jgi:hypothetical protein